MFGGKEEILGINCEHNRLSLTLMKGRTVKKTVCAEVPDNVVKGSEILSHNMFGGFLRDTMRQHGITCKQVAYALPGEDVFTRNVTLPKMDSEQIRINVPYEFRDFIRGELNDYVFDYANLPNPAPAEEQDGSIHLFAVAVERVYLEQVVEMFIKAGLKLVCAMPQICTFESLLALLSSEEERLKERCFLDIGQRHTRMLIYKHGRYRLLHMIDSGEMRIVQAVADEMNVDMYIARTYLHSNYQDCQKLPAVVNVYKDFSLEVLKGINFYEVSDMTSRLGDVVICGGGATIEPLVDLLKARIAMNVETLNELFSDWNSAGNLNLTAGSLGAAVQYTLGDGKKKAGGKGSKDAIKTSINFMQAEEKPSQIKAFLPAAAAVAVVALLFLKFGVIDRYMQLQRAESRVVSLQREIDEGMAVISGSKSLSDKYYHYTWSGMTEEEINRSSRADIAKLVRFIGKRAERVHSYTISEQELDVDLTADSLETISRIAAAVENRPIVQSCTVLTAQRKHEMDEIEVDARLLVYIKDQNEMKEEK